jgi:hypothetical protein
LFELGRAYRTIHREKEALIAKKRSYAQAWFGRRMQFLASQQELLNSTISVGKGLGDAFAWLFYHDDRDFLGEHLARKAVFHPPPGVGGFAELEFAKKIRSVEGYFVLHHCTTNILRLGDVSLLDLKTHRIAGIGEIKAGLPDPQSGKVEITLSLSGPALRTPERAIKVSEASRPPDPLASPRLKARLKRQMTEITGSLKVLGKATDWKEAIEHDNPIGEIDDLVDSLRTARSTSRRVGKVLLLLGYRMPGQTLYRRICAPKFATSDTVPVDLQDRVREILIPERKDNSILIGGLYYDEKGKTAHLIGMSHLVWWPLKPETIRRILFHEVVITTILNPAHLWEALEVEGFTVEESGPNAYRIFKTVAGKRVELHGIDHFTYMIGHYLFSESAIVQMLREVESKTMDSEVATDTKIEIHVQQMFGSRPTKRA